MKRTIYAIGDFFRWFGWPLFLMLGFLAFVGFIIWLAEDNERDCINSGGTPVRQYCVYGDNIRVE